MCTRAYITITYTGGNVTVTNRAKRRAYFYMRYILGLPYGCVHDNCVYNYVDILSYHTSCVRNKRT